MRPPSLHREELLPLVDVGSRDFEKICLGVIKLAFPDIVLRGSLKRRNGLPQYGVDVEGFDERHDPAVVISAKCYHELSAWDVPGWVDEFVRHLDGHWKGKNVRHFVLAITHECNDDPINDAARNASSLLKARGIQFHLWSSQEISDLVSKDLRLVDRYFNEVWVRAVSARFNAVAAPVAGPITVSQGLNRAELANQLKSIAEQLTVTEPGPINKAVTESLERAIATLRAGRSSEFERWLADAQGDHDTWRMLPAEVRSRSLRASAMLHLLRDDLGGAADLLDEADAVHPAPDRCARAMLDRSSGRHEDALATLEGPTTAHERELRATLLIETGRPSEALAFMGGFVGDAITPEMLRLRSIAQFEAGDRGAALRDAVSAQQRAPLDAGKLFTRGAMRLLCAFVPGVHGRFGDKPNPLHPALLLGTAEATTLLDGALADFDRLAAETENPFKEGAEAWKLAGLLLHPTRSGDVAAHAAVLLRRPIPDPVAVAWLLNFGRLTRRGRIKVIYHRELREGRGSATMLVVLARLIAGRDHPERGAALIRRHRGRFPIEDRLLDAWAVGFDDPDAPQDHAFAVATRRSAAKGDHGPLVTHMGAVGTSVEDLAAGCDLLAERGAWSEIDGLRERILTIGNVRAVELSAHAALQVDKPADCLSVLESAGAITGSRHLPRSLVYIRIKANEALGRYQPVVRDLLGLRDEDGDERIGTNLIEAYARIGALPQLRREAEQALAADRLRPEEALRVAQILKVHAPEVARRALAQATEGGIPVAAAGAVATLAAELGLKDLQERSIGLLVAPENAGPHVVRFDTVEAALSYVDTLTQQYRDVFGEWLRGRAPAAVAMHSDLKAFAYLYLADQDHRRNKVQDRFPMLLRSGARKRSTPTIDGEPPSLLLDLSALLLAHRLGILEEVERGFELRLASAIPTALMAMLQDLSQADGDLAATCREALQPGGRAVRVVDATPSEAVQLSSRDAPGELDVSVVARVLRQAYRAGHLDKERFEGALDDLGANAADGEMIPTCVASVSAFLQLARRGLLDGVSRGTSLHLSSADREEILRMLACVEHEQRVRDDVSKVLDIVSDRLLSGRWTMIPASAEKAVEPDGPKPAHMRCLQEVLAAVGQAPSLFWVEDRWLSHHRLEGLLDVVDIVDSLAKRDIITPPRRAHLNRRLSDMRYAFMPADADGVYAQVEAAPIESGQVVESPGLAERRAWFVDASDLARHLDSRAYPDEEGGFQGEIRHALDLSGLAREVLSRIWTSPTADHAERVARSEWVWTCLRSGEAPGWSEGSDIERRQNYAGLTAAWVLDLPLLATLGADGAPDFPGPEFMAWFSDAHVSAMCRADPSSRDVLVAFVAKSLVHLLQPVATSGDPATDEVHARAMAMTVKRFVDILPGDLGDRVSAHPGVGDRLGLHTVLVLTFGDGREVQVAHLADAYAAATMAHEPTRVDVVLAAGSTAALSVAAGPQPLPDAVLEVGSDRIELASHVCALLHPLPAVRSSALAAIPYLADPRGQVDRERLVAIAAIPTSEERLKALEDLLDADWFSTLQRLESGIRTRRSVRTGDLALPAPSSIGAYLRLPSSRITSADVAASTRSLEADLGWDEAAFRTAALPVALPTGIEAGFGQHLMDGFVDRREHVAGSPLQATQRLRALMAAGGSGEALVPGVAALEVAMRESAGLLVALVRQGASLALFDEAWTALDATAFVTLLWSRADALAHVLHAAGMIGDKMTQWVRRQTAVNLDTYQAKSALPDWAARLTIDLTVETFTTAAVGSLLHTGGHDRLTAESEASLQRLCGKEGDAGLSPPLEIAAPAPPAPEDVWPARDVVGQWVGAGWMSETHPFATRDLAAIMENVLALGDDAAARHLVPVLLAPIVRGGVAEPLLVRAQEVLDAMNAEDVLEPGTNPMFQALSARALVLARLDDVEAMRRVLALRAERCAERWPDDALGFLHVDRQPETAFAVLAAAALAFSLALPRSRSAQVGSYAACMTTIVVAWPNARRATIGRLDHLVRGLDAETAAAVWPTLMDLRRVV